MSTRPKPMRQYAAAVGLLDFLTLLVTSAVTYFLCYDSFLIRDSIRDVGTLRYEVSPQFIGVVLLASWLVALAIFKTRDPKIVGSDFLEYRRIFNASLSILGLLAFLALFFKVDVSRVYVSSIVFFGLLALLIQRRIARAWLRRQRKLGKFRRRVALYGPQDQIDAELERYKAIKDPEFQPIFIIPEDKELKIKILETGEERSFKLEELAELCVANSVELLQVVGSGTSASKIHKRLYWALDGRDISFIVSPSISGVSSSKLTTRVIAGSPLIEISPTKFTGGQYALKTAMDFVLGSLALLVTAPIVLIAAAIIKAQDGGPAFFKQTRVGLNGKTFTMYKLRSMKVGAELEHAELQAAKASQLTNSNMYKDPEDPRVTKIGRFIRKYSIDEIPQFLNTLKGDMSLVGPRPPLLSEVEQWKDQETRRLLVKPGVTGPWQIGGRSLLTWEETVAIDLGYVENWTLLTDVAIILRTIVYVLKGRGAF